MPPPLPVHATGGNSVSSARNIVVIKREVECPGNAPTVGRSPSDPNQTRFRASQHPYCLKT